MPLQFNQTDSVNYLQRFLTHNKARGMVSELALESYLQTQEGPAAEKVLAGGWLISPKVDDALRYRYIVFVLPELFVNREELQATIESKERDRGFQALSTFMSQSGIGVIVSGAISSGLMAHPDSVTWQNYVYVNERLKKVDNYEPFSRWPGTRGRASNGSEWQRDVLSRFRTASPTQLTALTLRQAFYYGYLKQQLHLPLIDPYDVDAFVVSFRGSVMPVEIKEKSPTVEGAFGIDAGRILMMLRLCLATDSNALYLIREVDESVERNFVRWCFITLSDMVMGCSWNLQAGGRGMLGGATQTVMLSGSLFETFSTANLSEEWLSDHSSLQNSVRVLVQEIVQDLSRYL